MRHASIARGGIDVLPRPPSMLWPHCCTAPAPSSTHQALFFFEHGLQRQSIHQPCSFYPPPPRVPRNPIQSNPMLQAVLPQSTPRRLIMAAAYSSRVRPTATATATSTAAAGTGAGRTGSLGGGRQGSGPACLPGFGSGFGSGGLGRALGGSGSGIITSSSSSGGGGGEIGGFGNRSFGSSSSSRVNVQRTGGVGFERSGGGGSGNSTSRGAGAAVVLKSAAARARRHAAYLEQYRRRPARKSKSKASLRRGRHGAEGRGMAGVGRAAGGAAVVGVAHEHDHHSGRSHEVSFWFCSAVSSACEAGHRSGWGWDVGIGMMEKVHPMAPRHALAHYCGDTCGQWMRRQQVGI